jgi:DNA-binding transcriptional ArsR family regulator
MSKAASARERNVVDVFFALGDGTRLSVVRKLGEGDALSATALSSAVLSAGERVTRQAIAKHLRVLEGAGLVTHERRGREVVYSLETRRLEQARAFLERVSVAWDRRIERLKMLVEEPAPPLGDRHSR